MQHLWLVSRRSSLTPYIGMHRNKCPKPRIYTLLSGRPPRSLLGVNTQPAPSTAKLIRITCTLHTALPRRRSHASSRKAVSAIAFPPVLRAKVRVPATKRSTTLQRNGVTRVSSTAQRPTGSGLGVAALPLPRHPGHRHSSRLRRARRSGSSCHCRACYRASSRAVVDVQFQPVAGAAVLQGVAAADHVAVGQQRGGGGRG